MSKRLDSLNSSKSGSTQKPGLKFKPKVVARKSDKERAKDAPVVKQESTGRPTRGRGGARGSRGGTRGRGGRFNYEGTHMVSSGPLSAGSVSLGNVNGSKLGLTSDRTFNSSSPTPEFLQNLKLKQDEGTKSPASSNDSDDDGDEFAKINMTKPYQFADEETVLFPVRAERDSPEPEHEQLQMQDPISVSATPSVEPRIKSEPVEEKLERIQEKKSLLETKITAAGDSFEEEEASKLVTDYQQILDLLTGHLSNLSTDSQSEDPEKRPQTNPDSYFVMHLPKDLPEYVTVKSNAVKEEQQTDQTDATEPRAGPLRGQIGHINIHQSGKISINLGNDITLCVSKGAPTKFLQELVMIQTTGQINDDDESMTNEDGQQIVGELLRLGEVENKIIATPLI
jgi:DNA-directed RNA polymerase III subunit RPC4